MKEVMPLLDTILESLSLSKFHARQVEEFMKTGAAADSEAILLSPAQ